MPAVRVTCAGLLLLATACSSGDGADPTPRPEPSSPTTELDTSGIALAGVSGRTTTTLVNTGTASITGSVVGPDGLIVGATVRVERLVAGREIRSDLVTGPDGRFLLENIPGGGYRVRAFLAPTLAQVVPDVRFLTDGEAHTFDLEVENMSGVAVQASVAPDPPLLRRPVNLVASVVNRRVDADGIVRSTPVVGLTVELVGLGRWVLRDDANQPSDDDTDTDPPSPFDPTTTTTTTEVAPPTPVARTGAGGQVRYELRCEVQGAPGLALSLPVTRRSGSGESATTQTTTETIELDLPQCVDPGTLTTTSTSTTISRSSTTAP
ncbi:MAG: carboxypeptidase-like regulatory domain-containing protein [Acidimicrobiales bacterium]